MNKPDDQPRAQRKQRRAQRDQQPALGRDPRPYQQAGHPRKQNQQDARQRKPGV